MDLNSISYFPLSAFTTEVFLFFEVRGQKSQGNQSYQTLILPALCPALPPLAHFIFPTVQWDHYIIYIISGMESGDSEKWGTFLHYFTRLGSRFQHTKKPRNSPGRTPTHQGWHSLVSTPTPKTSLGCPCFPRSQVCTNPGPLKNPSLCQLGCIQEERCPG